MLICFHFTRIERKNSVNQSLHVRFTKKAFQWYATAIHDSVATRCQYRWGFGLQVNKFEQVSGDPHQVSLGGVGEERDLMSDIRGRGG